MENTERDELASLLRRSEARRDSPGREMGFHRQTADDLIADGYGKHQRTQTAEEVADIIAKVIAPFDAAAGSRIQGAWSYGEMGPDNSIPLSQDRDALLNIADAILTGPSRPPQQDGR